MMAENANVMTEPGPHDADAPTVELNGKTWPIPPLAIKQLRKVRRPLIDLTDAIAAAGWAKLGDFFVSLSEEQYSALLDVVFHGLTRAHPDLKREEFDEWPVHDTDLLRAFFVVRAQSGLFVMAPAEEVSGP